MYKLRNSSDELSFIAFGCGGFSGPEKNGYSFGEFDHNEAEKAIVYAVENGINFFDTAPIYGFGNSETFVGSVFKRHKLREKVILATKFGLKWDKDRKVSIDNSPEFIDIDITNSLKRLQTDYIDIYLMHWSDSKTSHQTIVDKMESLISSGKIRKFGFCNTPWREVKKFAKKKDFAALQGKVSLFEQLEEDYSDITEKGIIYMGYETLAKGLLTSKIYTGFNFSETDVRKKYEIFQEPYFTKNIQIAKEIDQIAKKYNILLHQFVIAVTIKLFHNIPIVGIKNLKQAEENIAGININIDEKDLHKIKTIIQKS